MFFIGISMGGPYNMIGSAIAIDLGQDPKIKNKNAVTLVSSLLESTSILFTAASQSIIPLIRFDLMFLFFGGECLIGAFTLLDLCLKDIRRLIKNNR
jgi:hypothetical protein